MSRGLGDVYKRQVVKSSTIDVQPKLKLIKITIKKFNRIIYTPKILSSINVHMHRLISISARIRADFEMPFKLIVTLL